MPLQGREILPVDIVKALEDAGATHRERVVLLAIGMWEAGSYSTKRNASGGRYWVLFEGAFHENKDANGIVTSTDRGWLQINDKAWPKVTDAQAFDVNGAAAAGLVILRTPTGADHWAGWKNLMSPEARTRIKEQIAAGTPGPMVQSLAGAEMRWQRAMLGIANRELERYEVPKIPATLWPTP